MAINKVVNHGSKSHSGMKNVIGYVLRDDKVREGYVRITVLWTASLRRTRRKRKKRINNYG